MSTDTIRLICKIIDDIEKLQEIIGEHGDYWKLYEDCDNFISTLKENLS